MLNELTLPPAPIVRMPKSEPLWLSDDRAKACRLPAVHPRAAAPVWWQARAAASGCSWRGNAPFAAVFVEGREISFMTRGGPAQPPAARRPAACVVAPRIAVSHPAVADLGPKSGTRCERRCANASTTLTDPPGLRMMSTIRSVLALKRDLPDPAVESESVRRLHRRMRMKLILTPFDTAH
jgi:hypothetical protein